MTGREAVFHTVLVANRGEIALRVIRTLRRLGIRSAAVYSEADRRAPYVLAADVAVHIGPAPAVDSYLRIDRVIAAALEVGADALHPGYGFLSENAAFARACADAGVVFVGPPPEAIETMGDKITARRTVAAAGVRVVPGCDDPELSDAALQAAAVEIGFPVLLKPSAGGGGKGMRVVHDTGEFVHALAGARREAAAAFGDDTIFVERFVHRPRHVEVQVLVDHHGSAVHLGERECSLQRRHQKIVEEAPSPLLTDAERSALGAQALAAARACGYANAGTVEFIVSADRPGEPFFMEMNTRLQVEHPVTEMVWGLDLVEQQLRVAAGQPLGFTQDDLTPSGHAVEARIYAEDPDRDFLPASGRVVALRFPDQADPAAPAAGDPEVRVDAGVAVGDVIGVHYDPMIAKVVAHGEDRVAAITRLDHALAQTRVAGVTTNVGFVRRLLSDPDVLSGDLDTGLVERRLDALRVGPPPDRVVAAAALAMVRIDAARLDPADPWNRRDGWRVGGPVPVPWRALVDDTLVTAAVSEPGPGHAADAMVERPGRPSLRVHVDLVPDGAGWAVDAIVDGVRLPLGLDRDGPSWWVHHAGACWRFEEPDVTAAVHRSLAESSGSVHSPMPGVVVTVSVAVGDEVVEGQPVAAVEAMKMEHTMRAPFDGTVRDVLVTAGRRVERGDVLVIVDPYETTAEEER